MYHLRQRANLAFAVATLLALMALCLWTGRRFGAQEQRGPEVAVVVAARAIPAHTKLTPELLTTIPIARRYVLPTYQTNLTALGGQVALVTIAPGDVITTSVAGPPAGLGPDERLLTVAAGEQVIMEPTIQTGDRVDMIVAFTDGGNDRSELYLTGLEAAAARRDGEQLLAVTLRLTLEQARQVVWAENFGRQVRLVRQPARIGTERGRAG